MKRSIAGFVLGLISTIAAGICSYLYLVIAAFASIGAKGINQTLLGITPFINMAVLIIGLIGVIFCMIRRKVGGALMLFSSLVSIACILTLFLMLKTIDPTAFLLVLPSFMLFIASLIALTQKKVH